MKLFKNMQNSSLQRRMTLSFAILITVVLLFVTGIAYIISKNIIIEQTILTMNQSMSLIVEKIDFMRNELKTYSKINIADQEIQEYINAPELDFDEIKRIQRHLIATLEPRTFIDAAIIYNSHGDVFVPTSINLVKPLSSEEVYAINQRFDQGENAFASSTHDEYYYRDNRNRQIISFYYVMNSSYTAKRLGVLELSILEEFVYDLYKSVKIGETGQIFIVNQQGEIISSEDKTMINTLMTENKLYSSYLDRNKEVKIEKINGKKTLVINRYYPQLDWYVIGAVPIDEITKKSKFQSLIIIFSGFLFSFLAAIAIAKISKSVSNPIISLQKIIQKTIPGDMKELDTFDITKCSYEVGILADEFKVLNKKTYVLMEEIKEANRLEKEHDLHRLQVQMNPHFLYNTLETVNGLIDLEYHSRAIDLVNMIAAFYRGILSKGQITVSVAHDLNIVNCYIDIINVRYNDKLTYHIDLDDVIYCQDIVKLTLQPLVENALIHGLIGKKDKWIISITGYIENDKTYIFVTDNGIGMTKERFDEVISLKEKEDGGSFALRGTNERLKLHFGPEYGLEYSNEHLDGTQIKIVLPIRGD